MHSGRWYEDKINTSSVYTFKCQPKYMAPSVTLCEAMIQYLQYSDTIKKKKLSRLQWHGSYFFQYNSQSFIGVFKLLTISKPTVTVHKENLLNHSINQHDFLQIVLYFAVP